MLKFELPLPPSVNRLYVRSRSTGQPVLSEEHRAYRDVVWAAVMEQTRPEERELVGRLGVAVWVCRAKHRDLDNLCKALLDSLGAVLGFDDRRVDSLQVTRHEYGEMAPCVVMLWALPAASGAGTGRIVPPEAVSPA